MRAESHVAFYVVRVGDGASRRMQAGRRRVELESGATRDNLRAQWIDQLHRIPGEDAWCARIDKGGGVQLYRIEMDDSITPLIVHPATAIFGDTEGAVYPGYGHAPLATGVKIGRASCRERVCQYV